MNRVKSSSLPSTSQPRCSRGFTLLEVIIALGIVAVGILAVSRAMTGYIENTAALEQRVVASWVASNRLESLRILKSIPEPGTTDGSEQMAGTTWHYRQTVSTTADPLLFRVDITVYLDDQYSDQVAEMTGYLLNNEAINNPQETTSRSSGTKSFPATVRAYSVNTWSLRRTPESILSEFVSSLDSGLGFGILRRSRQLLLHCSTFAHPWARTSCIHAVVRRNDKQKQSVSALWWVRADHET